MTLLDVNSGTTHDGKTKLVTYEDNAGRKFLVQIPTGAPDAHAKMGVRVGPPDLKDLGLPVKVEVRLNNQLYDRGLFTLNHVRLRRAELQAALQSAYKVDAQAVEAAYEGVAIGPNE